MASIFQWQHPMMVTPLHYRQQTQRLLCTLCSYNRERGQQQVGRHGEGGGAELGRRRPLLAARPAPAQAAPLTDRAHRLRGHLQHRHRGYTSQLPPKNCEFLPVFSNIFKHASFPDANEEAYIPWQEGLAPDRAV